MDYHKIKRIILFIFEAWFRQVLKNPTPLGCVTHFRIFDYGAIQVFTCWKRSRENFKVDGHGLWLIGKTDQSTEAQADGFKRRKENGHVSYCMNHTRLSKSPNLVWKVSGLNIKKWAVKVTKTWLSFANKINGSQGQT